MDGVTYPKYGIYFFPKYPMLPNPGNPNFN